MNKLYVKMLVKLEEVKSLITREDGQDLVEYALLISLLSVAAIAFLPALASAVKAAFTNVEASL
jgi:pilus assembly protein Flp/PilA